MTWDQYSERRLWDRQNFEWAARAAGFKAVESWRLRMQHPPMGEATCSQCGASFVADRSAYGYVRCPCEQAVLDRAREEYIADNRAEVIGDMWQKAEIPRRLADRSFASFAARPGTAPAVEACRTYAEAFTRETESGLWLIGAFGSGKTHLAVATARAVLEKDLTQPYFATAADLIAAVRPEPGGKSFRWEALDRAVRAELLILDDLGQEQASEFTRDVLYRTINGRYEAERPIVLTSNLADAQLEERLGGAAVSRLYEMVTAVVVEAKDFRAEMARKRNVKAA